MTTRQPLALSLSGFQFTYRSKYFDWRLLHGIDIDTVIRLTDIQAVEDCLNTLQRGSFSAERDHLSLANCVQLFRLLQLAIEYYSHLRSAHAVLLDCYDKATAAAERWKNAALAYLNTAAAFLKECMATDAVQRQSLDATDAAKTAFEAADRDYNTALDELEAEDSRARHFHFRKHRTEISWSTLHAADADQLVSSLDVNALEVLLPNLTYGSITSEDDEQLTPHHFGQLVPLAQAALDYVLWQANATGALLEQAMAQLQTACLDIPKLTTAIEEMHTSITSMLLRVQQQAGSGVAALLAMPSGGRGTMLTQTSSGGAVGAGGSGGMMGVELEMGSGGGGGGSLGLVNTASGSPGPWPSASMDFGQPGYVQYGSGRQGTSPGVTRASSPFRPVSGGPGGPAQVLRLGTAGAGPSRMGTPGGVATPYQGPRRLSGSLLTANLDDLLAAAAGAGGGTGSLVSGAVALPVLELHSRTTELSYKVESIEQDLRVERRKTEEMQRILADIRDRLNQRPPTALGGLSPAGSLTFPAAAAANGIVSTPTAGSALTGSSAFVNSSVASMAASAVMGSSGASGGPVAGMRGSAAGAGGSLYGSGAGLYGSGAGLYGSAAGVSGGDMADVGHSPTKVRVVVDEDAIREQERQRAVEVLARQAEKLKQQVMREHQERRLVTSAATLSASQQLQQLGAGPQGLKQQDGGGPAGTRHSRQPSRDGRRFARRSSPGKSSRPGSGSSTHHIAHFGGHPSQDYNSDPELANVLATASSSFDYRAPGSRQGSGGGGGAGASKPPKPLSRLSGPSTIHGSLGDLPAATAGFGFAGGGGGGLPLRFQGPASGQVSMPVGAGARGGGPRPMSVLSDSAEDATPLPLPPMLASVSIDDGAAIPRGGPSSARPRFDSYGNPIGSTAGSAGAVPQSVKLAASGAFGSVSLVGPDKEAAAAAAAAVAAAASNTPGGSGNLSKASSFSERITQGSRISYTSAPDGGLHRRVVGGAAGEGSEVGWEAAGAVTASLYRR